MTEREGTPEDFARMFGSRPEPEPSEDEGDASEDETASKTEDETESNDAAEDRGHDAARAHNEFLTELFRGSPAKREANEQFVRMLHPPTTKEGDE